MSQPDDRLIPRYHELLLRLAGWAPDDLISDARGRLAEGRVSEVARSLLGAVVSGRLPIRAEDAELLVLTLPDVPEVAALATAVPALEPGAHPAFEFAPLLPNRDEPLPMVLDLTNSQDLDAIDRAVLAALDQVPGAIALWRAWRSPQPDRIAAGPVRVYLLESDGDAAGLPGVAAWLQQALAAAGVEDPQAEVFSPGADLPGYQRLARGRSALLWTAGKGAPMTIARVFDSYDPVLGGQFTAEHPLIGAGDELDRVLAYLDAGTVLLATTAQEPDIFDDGAGPVVPASFRTDGTWIWTDAVPYYLRTYALSPDEDLLAHIRSLSYRPPVVDAVTEHRALAALVG
ncbi:hypothetical protein GCM10010435_43010 [Winogradskya consettensis]|uniref:Uncharacterized protein n=1 Tax=Winogradskya consettensis TaxID=113560 RepID=A0A919T2N0_9ACTN|nr:hypothetical protein [Actinoplanes consettensis]GIM83505.1 hypothetical protein Aco04nite_86850 [Actinoplanes consettensis]